MSLASPEADLQKPVRYIKGVGEKLGLLLSKKRIFRIEDILFYFPRSYEDRRNIVPVSKVQVGKNLCVIGRVTRSFPVSYTRSARRSFKLILEDPDEKFSCQPLTLTWFHRPYVAQKLQAGTYLIAFGEIKNFRGEWQMVHPDIEVLGKNYEPENLRGEIVPIYSQTEGLYQKTIRRISRQVVGSYALKLQECLPKEVLEKYHFPSRSEAVCQLHFPSMSAKIEDLKHAKSLAHQRFIYEELFYFSLALAINRNHFVHRDGHSFSKPVRYWDQLKENLSFKFTNAQRKVLSEILTDMQSNKVMHRLIQGDVGSGKTVIAASAALVALESGYQAALMAPTEILVDQHFYRFQEWFRGMGVECVRLVSAMRESEKKEVLEKLSKNTKLMAFGTHALFEEKVVFSKLGLAIIDEQHRFGVKQRALFASKGERPDVLVMTATPIPRSLALTLYGDLDLSVIDELPPGRKPIVTKLFSERQRDIVFKLIEENLEKKHQAYIVFPLIEDSESLALKSIETMLPSLRSYFSGYNLACLHGKMSAKEKSDTIEAFRKKDIQILISTTVVEVGVDIPNATVMVVENAERFGLSQLHQLRGRVGRGGSQSYCYLVASGASSRESFQRLKTMERVQDGFKLSEVDLELRGPGEILGTRQAGLPEFELAQLPRDLAVLQRARRDAFDLVDSDPTFSGFPEVLKGLGKRFAGFHVS